MNHHKRSQTKAFIISTLTAAFPGKRRPAQPARAGALGTSVFRPVGRGSAGRRRRDRPSPALLPCLRRPLAATARLPGGNGYSRAPGACASVGVLARRRMLRPDVNFRWRGRKDSSKGNRGNPLRGSGSGRRAGPGVAGWGRGAGAEPGSRPPAGRRRPLPWTRSWCCCTRCPPACRPAS